MNFSGMGSVAIGSAPGAALFFLTYERAKKLTKQDSWYTNFYFIFHISIDCATHALSASLGEIVACLIRVPTEMVKQRSQVFKFL